MNTNSRKLYRKKSIKENINDLLNGDGLLLSKIPLLDYSTLKKLRGLQPSFELFEDRYSNDKYNLNISFVQNEDLEIKKKSEKKNLHRLFLPALKEKNAIIDSNNNLNSDTFRNTNHTRTLKSTNERIKQFELFKPARNSIAITNKKSINNMPIINTKSIDLFVSQYLSMKYFKTSLS